MTEESLNSNHARRLSATCRHIDKLLADMEHAMSVRFQEGFSRIPIRRHTGTTSSDRKYVKAHMRSELNLETAETGDPQKFEYLAGRLRERVGSGNLEKRGRGVVGS